MNHRLQQDSSRILTVAAMALAAGVFGLLVSRGSGQTVAEPGAAPPEASDCRSCHTCENPSPGNLCLRACSRAAAMELARKRAPDVVLLNRLEDLFLPVLFDHKGHAEMAGMTQGCAVCHHHTPAGMEHPACQSCHEVDSVRADIRKPGLKGAYHRQCLSCHREWNNETSCGVCHPPKIGRGGRSRMATRPTAGDIVGAIHPPIPKPDVEIYQTKHGYRPGTKVTFRHKEHVHRFGLKCVECHHEDSCLRCHETGKKRTQRVKTLEEHHSPCARCHNVEYPERCGRCHHLEGEAAPPPFDHATTGWPLGTYHKAVSCRKCHLAVPFIKADPDCNACHGTWDIDSFDHAVTGQQLDENHRDIDCEECHAGRRFDQPPKCGQCHDHDEVAFPSKRPGPSSRVKEPRPGEGENAKGR